MRLALVYLIGAVTARSELVQKLSQAPGGWVESHAASPEQILRLTIALSSPNRHIIEETLAETSDPSHPRYGQHLTRAEALTLIRPRDESFEAVRRWLADAGVPESHVETRSHAINVHVPVRDAETLLSTRFSVFKRGLDKTLGTLEYSVPSDIRAHVKAIQPTTFLDTNHRRTRTMMRRRDTNDVDYNNCTQVNTPKCLRELYHMPQDSGQPPNINSLLGIAGFSQQTALSSDLAAFLEYFEPNANGSIFSVETINGGANPQSTDYPSSEANLDIEYGVAMAYRVPVRFYSTGGADTKFLPSLDDQGVYIEPYDQFAQYLVDLPDDRMPPVMSLSYGVPEQNVDKNYAEHVCDLFGTLALRGMSIIVASGDTGPGASCQGNNALKETKYLPNFPASCPWVTSVGATSGKNPESAVNFSSGGFSEYFNRPKYQDEAVGGFIRKFGEKWAGYFNTYGRGFPDISAQGVQFPVYIHGTLDRADGASASAPLFASMVAIINDDRLNRGMPLLGFLNPWLYSEAKDFLTDITIGHSKGCTGESYTGEAAPEIADAGWDAVDGWDPATGLGTPLFDKLREFGLKRDAGSLGMGQNVATMVYGQ